MDTTNITSRFLQDTPEHYDATTSFESMFRELESTSDAEIIMCPSVADRISDLWVILFWPIYVVLCGLATGYVAAKISHTPPVQTRSCLAACAFGNSTGLAMTLLTVIHDQFKKSSELGSIDASAFLSVYLLLYPVLQWGVGGWLLAPDESGGDNEEKDAVEKVEDGVSMRVRTNNRTQENGPIAIDCNSGSYQNQTINGANEHDQLHLHPRIPSLHISHVLNHEPLQDFSPAMAAGQEEFGGVPPVRIIFGKGHRRMFTTGRIDSSNSGFATLMRELSFSSLNLEGTDGIPSRASFDEGSQYGGPLTMDSDAPANATVSQPAMHENVPLLARTKDGPSFAPKEELESIQKSDIVPLTETLMRVSRKVFQPPVIGALAGLLIASFPNIRGVLVNIWGDAGDAAPLQWMFDGIYAVSFLLMFCTLYSSHIALVSQCNSNLTETIHF